MLRDDRFQKFEVLPMTGALGAELRGVDLHDGADDIVEEVKRALHDYHVLAVRDQALDPSRLHAVRRRFGEFSGNPVHTPLDGYDDIVKFVREPDDSGKVIGEEWHMDLAWLPNRRASPCFTAKSCRPSVATRALPVSNGSVRR